MNSAELDRDPKRERVLKCIISAFMVLYVVVTVAHLSPEDIALRRAIVKSTNSVWKFLGMYQAWTLFSPKIRTVNAHSVAYVWFDDGTVAAYPLPRLEKASSFYEKFRYDKFRKWHGDSMQWEWYKDFWPQLAKYIGRSYYDAGKLGPKPVSFALICYKVDVPKPETNTKRSDLPEHDTPICSFFYRYKDGDLTP